MSEYELQIESRWNELVNAKSELEQFHQFVRWVIEKVPHIVYVYDLAEQSYVYSNREVAETLGYTREQIAKMGTRITDTLLHPDDLDVVSGRGARFEAATTEVVETQYRMKSASDEWRWFQSRELVFSRTGAGAPQQVIGIAQDITERKLLEERLRAQSTRDALSELYNRFYFEEEVARLDHSRQYPISTVMIDLNGLKEANDHWGHAAGDDLIKRTATILRGALRSEDIVARIGGDEFAILLPHTNSTAATQVIRRIRNLSAAHNSAKPPPPLDFSIGAATADRNTPLREAMKQADALMYQDKMSSRRA